MIKDNSCLKFIKPLLGWHHTLEEKSISSWCAGYQYGVNMKSRKNNLKALWVIYPILLMLLVSVTQIQAYELFWLRNTEFASDLGGWFTAYENPYPYSYPLLHGTVEWSSSYGGSVHLAVNGEVADLISFTNSTLYPGDTILCRVSTGTISEAFGFKIGAYWGDFCQFVNTSQSNTTQNLAIIANRIYSPGTPVIIHLIGSGEAWVQYVHFGRGGTGIFEEQNPTFIQTPTTGSLLRNPVPNPANKNVRIAFTVNERTKTIVKIYDKNGRLVKDFDKGTLNAGEHNIIWDGTDNNGKIAPSDVYFYELNTGGKTCTRKSVIIR
jgi:hypothetical protein